MHSLDTKVITETGHDNVPEPTGVSQVRNSPHGRLQICIEIESIFHPETDRVQVV